MPLVIVYSFVHGDILHRENSSDLLLIRPSHPYLILKIQHGNETSEESVNEKIDPILFNMYSHKARLHAFH